MFRRAERVPGRGVHDHDALAGRRFPVDVVRPHARADDAAESPVASQDLCRELRLAPADCAVVFQQGLAQGFSAEAGAHVVRYAFRPLEPVEPFPGQFIEYDDPVHDDLPNPGKRVEQPVGPVSFHVVWTVIAAE